MSQCRSLFPLALGLIFAIALPSCERVHYGPEEIVTLPAEDRAVLFGEVKTTTIARKQVAEEYRDRPIRWTASLFNVADSPLWQFPLGLTADGIEHPGDIGGLFTEEWRECLMRLREKDIVTVVGRLIIVDNSGFVWFRDCELIRAERDGKQIYPDLEGAGEEEAEGKKP